MDDWSSFPSLNAVSEPAPEPQTPLTSRALTPAGPSWMTIRRPYQLSAGDVVPAFGDPASVSADSPAGGGSVWPAAAGPHPPPPVPASLGCSPVPCLRTRPSSVSRLTARYRPVASTPRRSPISRTVIPGLSATIASTCSLRSPGRATAFPARERRPPVAARFAAFVGVVGAPAVARRPPVGFAVRGWAARFAACARRDRAALVLAGVRAGRRFAAVAVPVLRAALDGSASASVSAGFGEYFMP